MRFLSVPQVLLCGTIIWEHYNTKVHYTGSSLLFFLLPPIFSIFLILSTSYLFLEENLFQLMKGPLLSLTDPINLVYWSTKMSQDIHVILHVDEKKYTECLQIKKNPKNTTSFLQRNAFPTGK